MAIVVKTVKPDNSGNYSTLASWETAANGQNPDFWWAECYGGGDLGTVTLLGFTGTADASNYVRIYAATGERHAGVFDTNKAKILVGAASIGIVCSSAQTALNFLRIDGLQILANATTASGAISVSSINDFTIEANLLLGGATNKFTSTNGVLNVASAASTTNTNPTVRNNAVYPGASTAVPCIRISAAAAGGITGAVVYNNTTSGGNRGIGLNAASNSLASTITIANNICLGASTADFGVIADANSHLTKTGSYNLSSDATGDDWGATGALISQTAANVVTDVTADLRLKAGSPALNVGTDLSATFSTDAIGTTRPQGAAWDMGAFETIVSSVFPWWAHHLTAA